MPGIALVIVRLAAIPPTSRLGNSSTRASRSTLPALTWEPLSSGPEIYRALCAKIHAVSKTGWLAPDCHRIPNMCFGLNTMLVLPRLEADLALEAELISPLKLTPPLKLISPSKLISHPNQIHFVLLKLADPDTLHVTLVRQWATRVWVGPQFG